MPFKPFPEHPELDRALAYCLNLRESIRWMKDNRDQFSADFIESMEVGLKICVTRASEMEGAL